MLILATAATGGLSLCAVVNKAAPAPPQENQPRGSAGEIDFVRDIQPIFEKNCYQCHDAAKHKGGMRLDSKATAYVGGDSGDPSIIPSEPDKSKLIQLVRGDDPSAVMPPKGKRLSTQQVDLLVRWVTHGAVWPDGVDHPSAALTHWSFSKPVRPAIPQVKQRGWVRNPIDAFVLQKLEQNGLSPSAEADRFTLVRRLYLDLIGLPPSPQEVDDFVNDKASDAYEKLVDRLQADPHYGEKWARQWLDLARYADSAGYGSDPLRFTTFRWRDWVISAFNRNEPYDQFTVEQVAGDLLPHPTKEQLIATAFNRNTMTNTEGGTDPEEFRNEAIKDRTDTTVQAWMGLTMGCAKCHSHKYDPITNREYYQCFAFFNQTEDANRQDEYPTIPTPTPEQSAKMASFKQKIEQAEARFNDPARWASTQSQWEHALSERHPNWTVLDPATATASSGAILTRQPDGSIVASGTRGKTDVYTITAHSDLKGITAFRLEVLPDPSLPHDGPGRHDNGGFVLSNLRVAVAAGKHEPLRGRYVRVELPGHNRILHLAEVQVFHSDENLALHGKATQSSTDFGGDARLAIDGNTNGDYENHSVSHTAESDNPWWEVDLGGSNDLDRIVVWNRADGGFWERMRNWQVVVFDEQHKQLWRTNIDAPPNPSESIDLTGSRTIALKDASEDFYQTLGGEWTASKAADPKMGPNSGWAIGPEVGKAHAAVFQTAENVDAADASELTFMLTQNSPEAPIGRLRLSATTDPRPVRVLPEAASDALALAPELRSPVQRAAVFDYFRATAPEAQAERQQIAQLKKELEGIKPAVTAVMRELPPDKRRETHVLIKGNFLSKGPIVEPAVPAAFNPCPKDAPPNRLGLAMWLIDKDNPLTARVEVNRLWGQLFGTGIVETQEDFGTQGQPPSNQPLLDWMACEFMDPSTGSGQAHRWDLKHMVRLMVTSAAYRQSSRVSTESLARDPQNRLISRGPAKRLEAEFVRDEALSLSGLVSLKMFGPSIYPPQPDGLWQAAFNGERTYPTSTGEDRYRRGIYVFWRRTVPYPSMATFDAPSREVCTLRRIQTSTPLQAFVTLNDPVYVECSQALARRIMTEGGATTEERARFALRLCLCRPPDEQQVQRLISLYLTELDHYSRDQKAATEIATSDRGPLPKGMWAGDAAAWTVCANVLLNMDGVLTKR